MNPRIRELWDKAAESTAAFPSGQNNSWETQVKFMEKFAQLIVQECIDISTDVEDEALQNREFKAGSAATLIKILIKKHFEIE